MEIRHRRCDSLFASVHNSFHDETDDVVRYGSNLALHTLINVILRTAAGVWERYIRLLWARHFIAWFVETLWTFFHDPWQGKWLSFSMKAFYKMKHEERREINFITFLSILTLRSLRIRLRCSTGDSVYFYIYWY